MAKYIRCNRCSSVIKTSSIPRTCPSCSTSSSFTFLDYLMIDNLAKMVSFDLTDHSSFSGGGGECGGGGASGSFDSGSSSCGGSSSCSGSSCGGGGSD